MLIRLIRKYYSRLLKIGIIHSIYCNFLIHMSKTFESFIEKDPSLIVFGSSNGIYYADNAKYLFQWANYNRPGNKYVWLTHRRAVRDNVRQNGFNAELAWSLNGIRTLFRAKVGCYTNTLRDLSMDTWLFPSKIKLIALRHGKSVKGVQASLKKDTVSEVERKSRIHEKQRIVALLSTSDLISDMTDKSLRVGLDKIFVTGYPRNDSFILDSQTDRTRVATVFKVDAQKILLYAPSWRNGREPTRFFPFDDFDRERLSASLETKRILLLLRPHPNDLLIFPEITFFLKDLSGHSRFIELADSTVFPDIFSILPFIDCLITDYSATYHDFLLRDKPLWFIPYDYEGYKNENGFLYDYLRLMPGPNISSFTIFIEELTCLAEGTDNYWHKRHVLRTLIHKHCDGNSSRRVVDLIASIIES